MHYTSKKHHPLGPAYSLSSLTIWLKVKICIWPKCLDVWSSWSLVGGFFTTAGDRLSRAQFCPKSEWKIWNLHTKKNLMELGRRFFHNCRRLSRAGGDGRGPRNLYAPSRWPRQVPFMRQLIENWGTEKVTKKQHNCSAGKGDGQISGLSFLKIDPRTDVADLKFAKKITRPIIQAKEFYTLKTRKSWSFCQW